MMPPGSDITAAPLLIPVPAPLLKPVPEENQQLGFDDELEQSIGYGDLFQTDRDTLGGTKAAAIQETGTAQTGGWQTGTPIESTTLVSNPIFLAQITLCSTDDQISSNGAPDLKADSTTDSAETRSFSQVNQLDSSAKQPRSRAIAHFDDPTRSPELIPGEAALFSAPPPLSKSTDTVLTTSAEPFNTQQAFYDRQRFLTPKEEDLATPAPCWCNSSAFAAVTQFQTPETEQSKATDTKRDSSEMMKPETQPLPISEPTKPEGRKTLGSAEWVLQQQRGTFHGLAKSPELAESAKIAAPAYLSSATLGSGKAKFARQEKASEQQTPKTHVSAPAGIAAATEGVVMLKATLPSRANTSEALLFQGGSSKVFMSASHSILEREGEAPAELQQIVPGSAEASPSHDNLATPSQISTIPRSQVLLEQLSSLSSHTNSASIRATDVVHQITQMAESLRSSGKHQIDLSVTLDDGQEIKITLRNIRGQMQPEFQASSPELLFRLEQGWNQFSASALDRGVRYAPAAFANTAHQHNPERHPKHQDEGIFALDEDGATSKTDSSRPASKPQYLRA